MFARFRLVAVTLLLITTACSNANVRSTEYKIETTCEGGGGIHKCVARNVGTNKIGPFDIEMEAIDDRGSSLGRSTVRNDQGLEPRGEWQFDFVSSPRTRSVRFVRVIPR
jgi:hypothetical protein